VFPSTAKSITLLKKIDRVAHEISAEIVCRNMPLNQRPHLTEQLRTGPPAHDNPPGTPLPPFRIPNSAFRIPSP
jgi:hypothetical protein